MATTTNYSWTTPDDTDLVKDGASAIRSLGTAIDSTVFTNAGNAVQKSTIDAKGDLLVGTADNTIARLAVGTNGYTVVADSAQSTGLKYAVGQTKHGCLLYDTTNQLNLTQNTNVAVTWTLENFDTDAYHDNSTNTSRITIPTGLGGIYQINAGLRIEQGASNTYSEGKLYKNGSLYKTWFAGWNDPDIGLSPTLSINVDTAANDYWEIYWFTNSAGAVDITKSTTWSYFGAVLIGV